MRHVLFVGTHDAGRSADGPGVLGAPRCARRRRRVGRRAAAARRRADELTTERIDLVRADRTAHERRPEALLPGLIARFAGEHTDAEIRTVADAVLLGFPYAPIRSFVLPLAAPRACELLAAGAHPA